MFGISCIALGAGAAAYSHPLRRLTTQNIEGDKVRFLQVFLIHPYASSEWKGGAVGGADFARSFKQVFVAS